MNKLIATVAAILILGAITPVLAAEPGDIMMVGFLWMRVRCPAAGYTAQQRVDTIQARVNDLLVIGGIDLSTVKVVPEGRDASIYANGKLLVTVDECTARANQTTPILLANVWANRFKEIYPQVVPKLPEVAPQQP